MWCSWSLFLCSDAITQNHDGRERLICPSFSNFRCQGPEVWDPSYMVGQNFRKRRRQLIRLFCTYNMGLAAVQAVGFLENTRVFYAYVRTYIRGRVIPWHIDQKCRPIRLKANRIAASTYPHNCWYALPIPTTNLKGGAPNTFPLCSSAYDLEQQKAKGRTTGNDDK